MIVAYAETNTGAVPSADDYYHVGVTGVTNAAILGAVNSTLASAPVMGASANTVAELQAIVDVYSAILNAADNTADADSSLSASQFAVISLTNIESAAEVSLMNDVIDQATLSEIDSHSKLTQLASTVEKLMTLAATTDVTPGPQPVPLNTGLTVADLAALGLTGVTAENLNAILAAFAATINNGSGINTLASLQAVTNTAISAYTSSLATISAYAGTSSIAAGSTPPTTADYLKVGVILIPPASMTTDALVTALNSILGSPAVTAMEVDSPQDIQAIVDVYQIILNGADASNDNDVNLTSYQYALLGLTQIVTPSEVSLLNDVLDQSSLSSVDSYADLNALATTVDKLMSLASTANVSPGPQPVPTSSGITVAELTALGLSGVSADNLNAILASIAGTSDTGNGIDTLTKLQAVADAAIALQASSLSVISRYAGNANMAMDGAAPSVSDYLLAGVILDPPSNMTKEALVTTLNTALASLPVEGGEVNTSIKLQKFTDVYTNILKAADGVFNSGANAMTSADLEIVGLPTLSTSELAMFKSALDLATTEKVDTWQELKSFVEVIQDIHVVAALASFSPASNSSIPISDDDFALIGIRGVTEDNLIPLLKLIAETFDANTPPTLSGIQALVNGLAALADGQRQLVDIVKTYDGTLATTEAIVLNYKAAGLENVEEKHLEGLNRVYLALESAESKDSFGEVKSIVDQYFVAYDLLRNAADNNGSTPSASNPYPPALTGDHFADLGLGMLNTSVEIKLANDLISNMAFANIETSDQQLQLANLVENLFAHAAGSNVSDQISLAELQQAGITNVTSTSLYAFLSLVASSNDNGSAIDTLAKLQLLALDAVALQVSSLAEIQTYAAATSNALPTPAPSKESFALAGILRVTSDNLDPILSVLASVPIGASQVQSVADVQLIVDAIDVLQTDATQATRQIYETLGISLGSIALPANQTVATTESDNALQLLNEIVENSFASSSDSIESLDTFNELQAMSTIVNALYSVASRPVTHLLNPVAGISLDTLAMAGFDMLDAVSLEAFLQLVSRTADDGSAINTYEKLLALAQQAVLQGAAISAISAYAQADGGAVPALQTYQLAGVTGLTDANGQTNTVLLRAVNDALLSSSVNGIAVDTTAEIQTLVDAYSRILLEANGSALDSTQIDPSSADYGLVGATVAASLTPEGLSVLNDVIGNKSVIGVDTISEIDALASTVSGLIALQSLGSWVEGDNLPSSLTLDQSMLDALGALGITGLALSDLPGFFESMSIQSPASNINTLVKIQAIAAQVVENNALDVLRDFANTNQGNEPTRRDYNVLGLSVVSDALLNSYNDALASLPLVLNASNTIAKQQLSAMVNAFDKIFAEANGTKLNTSSNVMPQQSDYLAIGATVAGSLANGSAAQLLLTDIIALGEVSDVDRISKIDALARISEQLIAAADHANHPVTLVSQDLTLIGLHGVNEFVLAQLLIDMAATANDGTAVDSLAEIQALIDAISNRMPTVSGVSISVASKLSSSGFVTNQLNQTITASLDTILNPTRYQLYGRLDGEGSFGTTGWLNLSSSVSGSVLTWSNATLETGLGRSIQLKVVDTLVGSEHESPVLNRSYRYLDPAVFAAIQPAALELEAQYPFVNGFPEVPRGGLRLSLSVAAPADTGEIRLYINNGTGANTIEIASLFHAATRSLIPLYPLPEGEWEIQYRMFDLAGNASQTSGGLSVRIVSPQNMLSQEDPYSYGLHSGSQLLEAISRDAVSVGSANTSVTINADGKRLDAISQLNMNPVLNDGGALRADIQIDNVAVRPDGTAVALAQRDVDTRFAAGQYGDFVFKATDVIMFRLYPQVVTQDGRVVDATVKENFSRQIKEAYTGAMHQVDLKIADGLYSVSDYEVTYYKTMSDGTVIPFDWDAESGTGGTFYDTNNDGSYDLITLFIRDGGRGDVDGEADGVILDPGFAVFFQRSVAPPVVPANPANPANPVNPVNPVNRVLPNESVRPSAPVGSAGPKFPLERLIPAVKEGFSRNVMTLNTQALESIFNNLNEPVPQFLMSNYADGIFKDGRFGFLRGWSTSDANLLRISDLFHKIQTSDYLEVRQSFDLIESPNLTSSDGYRMMVIEVSGTPLAVYRGHPDLTLTPGALFEYQIPSDVFAHADPKAVVLLKLTQLDGKPLPGWIQFNGKTGKLLVQPPEGVKGDYVVRLAAIDQAGREVVTIFRMSVRETGEVDVGRSSFSDKIKRVVQSASLSLMVKGT